MSTESLSLFPLSAVLLPHGRMPLRIFERRYVDLVRDSMRSGEGFGIVHIERGAEVGTDALPVLAPVGTVARIVDWDQLDDGLLGITVAGGERFALHGHHRAESGLIVAEVELLPAQTPPAMRAEWQPLAALLEGLEAHPHVQRIGLQIDRDNPLELAYALLQLLPLEEGFKARLLTEPHIEPVIDGLLEVLGDLSGEDSTGDSARDGESDG